MKMTEILVDYFPSGSNRELSGTRGRVVFVSKADIRNWASRACMNLGGDRYVVCDELHHWFMEISPSYCLQVKIGKKWVGGFKDLAGNPKDRCAFVLQFRDPKLAMMFKLRWFTS